MSILETIVRYKKLEVAAKKKVFSVNLLEKSPLYSEKTRGFATTLGNTAAGIIAEFKRRSPSKDVINNKVNIQEVARGYKNAGVACMSVLTDASFFGGSLDDLLLVKDTVSLPILRKDFIIDTYQIVEAKAYGADAILLIAAILTEGELKKYSAFAKELGLDVLLEIHNETELQKSLHPTIDIIGVNNRNLKTFEVSVKNSEDLAEKIPDHYLKISESGIRDVETIQHLKTFGYQGFLIGENFMKTSNPGASAKQFIDQLL